MLKLVARKVFARLWRVSDWTDHQKQNSSRTCKFLGALVMVWCAYRRKCFKELLSCNCSLAFHESIARNQFFLCAWALCEAHGMFPYAGEIMRRAYCLGSTGRPLDLEYEYATVQSRSQWLRRRSAAARLLRSWIRIPPGAWMFVCCEYCVLSVRGLYDELITRPEESYRLCCVVVCGVKTQEWGGYDPRWVAAPQQKKKKTYA